jgi:hypothetical protein
MITRAQMEELRGKARRILQRLSGIKRKLWLRESSIVGTNGVRYFLLTDWHRPNVRLPILVCPQTKELVSRLEVHAGPTAVLFADSCTSEALYRAVTDLMDEDEFLWEQAFYHRRFSEGTGNVFYALTSGWKLTREARRHLEDDRT